jgi:hypothetical protein
MGDTTKVIKMMQMRLKEDLYGMPQYFGAAEEYAVQCP